MSVSGETISHNGFDAFDHQPAYIYAPSGALNDAPERPSERPAKRQRVVKQKTTIEDAQEPVQAFRFDKSLDGLESSGSVALRQELYEKSWSESEARIQHVLDKANEDTLAEVIAFVNGSKELEGTERVPAGFIVTGPNIASQSLLFKQLFIRLKEDINGPVVILRSGDSSNLKAFLKQLLREATNQKPDLDEEEGMSLEQDGRKLLNYDLEILHGFVKAHGNRTVVVAFQDSEAFDTSLVADIVTLFNSWMDRIPFVLLFGVATSVDLFHERLSRAASQCLHGAKFDVEQTSSVLGRIFQKAVAGSKAPIRLGTTLVSSLMERQHDHFQSVESFTAALKYAYMCHFYGNPLSVLLDLKKSSRLLQSEHFEAVRMLPSFRNLVLDRKDTSKLTCARGLLEDDAILKQEIEASLANKDKLIARLVRTMHVLASSTPELVGKIELYMKVFEGTLNDSEYVRKVLDSTKRMAPDDIISFLDKTRDSIENGCVEMDLEGWADEESSFLKEIAEIQAQVASLVEISKKAGKPVRSSYAIQSKGVRTTVIAQRVQLSYEKSTLSKQDEEFTSLVDRLTTLLQDYFTCKNPQDLFLHEVWLYDSTTPYKEVFTPRPRAAIERALTAPHDYLCCECCKEGGSSTQPSTATIYQWYLEAGSLINIADLWRAFADNQTPDDEDGFDEREALVSFYRALADLKLLGMVKQSKRKADHLAKISWNGL